MTTESQPFDAGTIELSGKNLIEASAGTGKTYAITTLFVRLLLEHHLEPKDILVVTFTEAATAELRDRVRSRVVEAEAAFHAALSGGVPSDDTLVRLVAQRRGHIERDLERLRRALEQIDDAPISTLHGFCQRVLHDQAFRTRTPFDAELVSDLSELHDDVLYDFWQRQVAGGSEGLARQAAKAGVSVASMRALMQERLRNPSATITPAIANTSGELEQEIGRALSDLQRDELGLLRAKEFAKKYCDGRLWGKAGLEVWLARFEACVHQSDAGKLMIDEGLQRFLPATLHARRNAAAKKAGHQVPPYLDHFARLVAACWRRPVTLKHDFLQVLERDLPQRKLEARVLGFEDLLLRVKTALEADGGDEIARALRARYRAVLIDEVQDTDPVQFAIFERVFVHEDHPLFFIGDPKQAIYSFRGADVFAYVAASQGANRFTMGTSHRSDPAVLAAVNGLFTGNGRFLVDGIEYSPVAARPDAKDALSTPHLGDQAQRAGLDLLFLERPVAHEAGKLLSKARARSAAARAVAADIVRLLSSNATIERGRKVAKVEPADIAVLTRRQVDSFAMQQALRERGVPAVVSGDRTVFEADEALSLQVVLSAVLEPLQRRQLRSALATPLLGVRGDELAAHEDDVDFWTERAARFRRWHELWVQRGFMRMFRALLLDSNTAEHLLAQLGGERQLTNVLHLGELLHRASVEQHLGPAALLAWLAEQRGERAATAERAEIRLESDDAAVKIMTAHKAKGLEFPIVYCPFLWDGRGERPGIPRFHDDERRLQLDIDPNGVDREQHERLWRWEEFAEELRVVYVALTRAKHRTTVVWGGFNGIARSPASTLLHEMSLDPNAKPGDGRLEGLTDDALFQQLTTIVTRYEGAISLRRERHDYDAKPLETILSNVGTLEPRAIEKAVTAWQRTGSFSSLIRHEQEVLSDEEEARDHDEQLPVDDVMLVTPPAVAPALITLAGLPRGARMGNLFHEIFEEIDFATVTDVELALLARSKLEMYGVVSRDDLPLRSEQVVRAVRETLSVPLPPLAARLADIPLSQRKSELEFRMPAGSAGHGLTRARLARVFRDHPSTTPAGAVPTDYANRVERLGFRELQGFLVGFVDLVFEHQGRWYVVDYKTNHLGDSLGDYDAAAMRQALAHSHYYLQYHLYALALHRHLAHFLPGYAYDRHFGGVLYLFIKGMHPSAPTGSGVFFEKPPLGRLQALALALAGEGSGERAERGEVRA